VSDILAIYKFFRVVRCPLDPGRKTRVYEVVNLSSNCLIGTISWYASWRQFVLTPVHNSVWSKGCLADIQDAIAKAEKERQANV